MALDWTGDDLVTSGTTTVNVVDAEYDGDYPGAFVITVDDGTDTIVATLARVDVVDLWTKLGQRFEEPEAFDPT